MKIAVAGTGYVGLVTAVCLAEHNNNVVCVDVDINKITKMQSGSSPIFEPGLEELMLKNKARLEYTTNYKQAYAEADIIFIGVGTPEKKDGSANLSYVYNVATQIKESVRKDCIVVVKSTVPIGSNDKLEILLNNESKHKIDVVSNPEFLAQGTAVRDTLNPSRVVIGANSEIAKNKMLELYKDFSDKLVVTDRKSAEMIKYASNDFLALKISYINEIANLCELIGANVDDVAKGMGLDERIGKHFLQAGIGYGGSCFPKDTKALHWLASYNDYELKTVKAAIEVNENQKIKLLKKARKYYPNGFSGIRVACLGLTFKPNTDDLREAPSLVNIPVLVEDGASVIAYDPIAIDHYKNIIGDNIEYTTNIDEALKNADLCLIFTDWQDIKNYRCVNFKKLMKNAIVLDGRNCFDLVEMKKANVQYESIGR